MGKKGLALILTFMVILVLTILGTAIVSKSVSEVRIAQQYTKSAQAFWIAEAGVAQALTQLKNDFNNLNSIAPTPLGQGQYSVDTIVVEGPNRRLFTAHGFVPSAAAPRTERKITVLVQNLGGIHPDLITYAIETSGILDITEKLSQRFTHHDNSGLTFQDVFGMTEDEVKAIAVTAQAQGTGQIYTNPPANQQPVNGITWVELTGGNKYSISSNWSGSGLLIVNSNGNNVALDISGTWNFTGMIWVNGGVKISGTPNIAGAVFARSSVGIESDLSGTPTIDFNSLTVASAFGLLGQGGGFKVLSWQEL